MWIAERALSKRGALLCPPCVETDEARLRLWVEQLAVPRHRLAEPRANSLVRERLADELSALGYRVQVQGRYRNVVALPRDERDARPLRFVAAHYDSVPGCPGADDNASALAAMLECARGFSRNASDAPVGFVAFNAEEDGLLGSRDFAADGMHRLRNVVRCFHVLEMVGYRTTGAHAQTSPLPWTPPALRTPDFLGLVTKGASNASIDVAGQCRAGRDVRVVTMKTWGPLHKLVPDLTRSDHFAFWLCGVPAVLWTDTANFRNPHYHQPTDTPDTLDYAFMRGVTELLFEVLWRESVVAG